MRPAIRNKEDKEDSEEERWIRTKYNGGYGNAIMKLISLMPFKNTS